MLKNHLIRILFFLIVTVPYTAYPATNEIKKTSLSLPQNPADFEFIRISLLNGKPEIHLSTDSAFHMLNQDGADLFSGEKFKPTTVRANAAGIQVGSQTFHDNPITLVSENGTVKLGDKPYRHALKIWRGRGKNPSGGE